MEAERSCLGLAAVASLLAARKLRHRAGKLGLPGTGSLLLLVPTVPRGVGDRPSVAVPARYSAATLTTSGSLISLQVSPEAPAQLSNCALADLTHRSPPLRQCQGHNDLKTRSKRWIYRERSRSVTGGGTGMGKEISRLLAEARRPRRAQLLALRGRCRRHGEGASNERCQRAGDQGRRLEQGGRRSRP